MTQQQKEHVREYIEDAALAEFAAVGFHGTTIAAVAKRARTSVGNLYKYFQDKDALLVAALPRKRTIELQEWLLKHAHALDEAFEVACYPGAIRDSFRFLLRHAAGTPYASFRAELEGELVAAALVRARREMPTFRVTASNVRALNRIFHSLMGSFADLLEEDLATSESKGAVGVLVGYHEAGLRAFLRAK